jgi:hypothetical protein
MWVDWFGFKSSEGKLAAQCCAMISWNRPRQGSELRLFPAWIDQVVISHYFENSLLAGGLGCSSAKSSVLLWFYFAMTRMDNGWMSDGCRQEIGS